LKSQLSKDFLSWFVICFNFLLSIGLVKFYQIQK